MQTAELIRSIVKRTGLPHDEVRLVLDTVLAIAKEQLSMYESIVIPGMVKIAARYEENAWVVKAALYRELTDALGTGVIKVD